MNRRDAVLTLALGAGCARYRRSAPTVPTVSTLIGTGRAGLSDDQVNDPYGLAIGPDGALYFCDLGNQRIRRVDLRTGVTSVVAGTGQRAYGGDGGPALRAPLNMPHEVQFDRSGHLFVVERDNHVVRRIDRQTGVITTVAGTGTAGYSGDGGAATRAQLRSPHSIVVEPNGRRLLVCDVGNRRIRAVDLVIGIIETIGGTGGRDATRDGALVKDAALNGPRTIAIDERGDLYLALREGNAIYRIASASGTIHHVAGTGAQGYAGDGGPARDATLGGPKGLAYARGHLYVADTENHVIRRIDLRSGIITTVLGTGKRGDGPEPDPRECRLNRPHGLLVDDSGTLYVADSEAHRIRMVRWP